MKLRMPAYCMDFACKGSDCGDNCCIGWEIDIDDRTMDIYNSVRGAFGKALREGIDREKGCFRLNGERCPFLNKNNLCEIILNLGEDKLCHICAEHPRYYEWFEGLCEGGIGMCCEEAARLILQDNKPLKIWEREIPDEDCGEYDHELADYLFSQRETALEIVTDNSKSLGERLSELLCFGEKLQQLIDNGIYSAVAFDNPKSSQTGNAAEILAAFLKLEPIDEKWQPAVKEIISYLPKMRLEKAAFIAANPLFIRSLENIAVYFIWRYFMKGAFDREILSKLKLAVISVIVITLSAMEIWLRKGELSTEDCVTAAKNYSKEVEYSEENLDMLADFCYENTAFSSKGLIALLRE